jgi:hypothetical protein
MTANGVSEAGDNGSGIDAVDYQSASVLTYVGGSDFQTDNCGAGCAVATAYGQVSYLGLTYTESSSHWGTVGYDPEICAMIECSFLSWQANTSEQYSVNVPGPPSIQPVGVSAYNPNQAYISYTVSPPVLFSATMQVGGQTSFSGAGSANAPNFYFDESALPDGTSTFDFTGYMFGIYVFPSSAPTVTRSNGNATNTKVLLLAADAEDGFPLGQPFTLNVYESYTTYSYSLASGGLTTMVNGGTANMSTPAGGATIVLLNGQNSVNGVSATMAPNSGIPPNGDTFYSVANTWNGFFSAPGASAQICAQLSYETENGMLPADFGCPGMTLP